MEVFLVKKNFLKTVSAFALALGMVFACGACKDTEEKEEMKDNGLSVTQFTEPVALVDESVLTYLRLPSDAYVTNIVQSLGNEVRQDKGLPVTIGYILKKKRWIFTTLKRTRSIISS